MATPSRHRSSYFCPTDHEYRHRPAEYSPHLRSWIQDGRKLHSVKPSYAFIWPKDGKQGSKLGRMRDILSGKGPDIHISISADKRDHMFNRQRQARWSNWTNLDDRGPDNAITSKHAPWTRNLILGGRNPGLKYDFRTRRYTTPNRHTWSDAVWQPDADKNMYPEAVRTVTGRWLQDGRWLPCVFGGPVCNDTGRHIFM